VLGLRPTKVSTDDHRLHTKVTRQSELDVAVGHVGRSGGRARWVAIAWVVAVVAVVAPSIGQRLGEGEPAQAPAIAIVGPHADPGPAASPVPDAGSRPIRAPGAPARTSGEDGLMGSLVLDLEPSYPFVLWWPGRDFGYMSGQVKS
jgi:hypothetical protein